MTPAVRLIVALDGDARKMGEIFQSLYYEAGLRWFKLGTQIFLQRDGWALLKNIVDFLNTNLFYDLKLYDTRDTVDRTVRRAFDLGARFVTVHATPSVMEAAMRAKPADPRCKVLAVGHLTDDPVPFISSQMRYALDVCDGIVCSAVEAGYFLQNDWKKQFTGKLLVCPGIRSPSDDRAGGYLQADDHHRIVAPGPALRAGADYLVVGRPIVASPDPVAAARAILKEMADAAA